MSNPHDVSTGELVACTAEQFKAKSLKVTCPACGSTANYGRGEEREYKPPFGKTERYAVLVMHCTECQEEWGYEPDQDTKRVSAILQHADQATVPVMLNRLEAWGYNRANIKRLLGMREHYQTNWHTDAPESVIVLLRILATYPWILEVAGKKFDPEVARTVLLQAADQAAEDILTTTGSLGDPQVRDPAAPCRDYLLGKPGSGLAECHGDGHYLCRECANFEAERCGWTCPHGDQCTLEVEHEGGHNHQGCDCNEPDSKDQ